MLEGGIFGDDIQLAEGIYDQVNINRWIAECKVINGTQVFRAVYVKESGFVVFIENGSTKYLRKMDTELKGLTWFHTTIPNFKDEAMIAGDQAPASEKIQFYNHEIELWSIPVLVGEFLYTLYFVKEFMFGVFLVAMDSGERIYRNLEYFFAKRGKFVYGGRSYRLVLDGNYHMVHQGLVSDCGRVVASYKSDTHGVLQFLLDSNCLPMKHIMNDGSEWKLRYIPTLHKYSVLPLEVDFVDVYMHRFPFLLVRPQKCAMDGGGFQLICSTNICGRTKLLTVHPDGTEEEPHPTVNRKSEGLKRQCIPNSIVHSDWCMPIQIDQSMLEAILNGKHCIERALLKRNKTTTKGTGNFKNKVVEGVCSECNKRLFLKYQGNIYTRNRDHGLAHEC